MSEEYRIDHYVLQSQLGEGGMGTVYKAWDSNLNRHVAIKLLRKELTEDEKFVQTFIREVEITAVLTHPNIVQVYSFGQIEGRYYLVMELIESPTLDDIILNQPRSLTELQIIEIGIGVASGLDFALQRGGLIHRDIKPGNMLFGTGQAVKVVDFGLALTPETADSTGEIWGTPYYISPERLEGIPEDFRSDMYSLGVSLYHAAAGRPPFDADTAEIVASKHLIERPLPLQTFAPYLSENTAYAIMRAMARQPADRFASYAEFIGQLEDSKRRILNENSAPASQSYEIVAQSEADKNIIWIVVGVVVLVVLAVGGFFAWKFLHAV